ncbi:L-dopachrome tautomerase yellow-f-like [Bombyx mandarina]|uniref:L-dopachrome tautomerase yellow-f-like n=1 Tax=Bombyx mandarina TaxID=7092 RepID=A0A6J2JYB6_BOMMA|nr:L-dopachrome tautomerase yellow-f-like [Bombyx mandarina]
MLYLLLIQLIILPVYDAKRNFTHEHSWSLFSYDIDGVKYTNDSDYEYKDGAFTFRNVALEEHEKFLIRQNLIPYDFIYDVPRITISIPRTRPGIPFTVNFIDRFLDEEVPMLRPFPNSNEGKEFTSVFNMFEDSCSRLWFVDTGYLDIPGVRKQVQPASLILYSTNLRPKFQFRKNIDSAFLHNGITSGLRSLSVDFILPCSESYVYITDDTTGDLIVFSLQDLRFTKISRASNTADSWEFIVPQFETQYRLEVEKYRKRPKETYEHYVDFLNSTNQLYDPISDSRPRDTFNNTYYPNYEGLLYTKNFEGNILLFTNWNRNKLYCWNMDTPYEEENVDLLSKVDEANYRFSALDASGSGCYALIQRTLNSTSSKFNEEKYNFWFFSNNLEELLEGSKCTKSNQCTDYVMRRSASQTLLFSKRIAPKYVSDNVIRNVENIWKVKGIMN